MAKKERSVFRIFFNIAMVALMIGAMVQAFAPYVGESGQEVKGENEQLITIKPEEVAPMALNAGGKPVMLVVYASWCPYCREVMPGVAELIREHKLDRLKLIFLSVDTRQRALAAYLVAHNYQGLFTPYVIAPNLAGNLPEALRPTGSQFDGRIPFIGFYDSSGKPVARFPGMMDKNALLAAVEQLK